ncbi:MAG: site-2 protease family protein [Gemmatimonadales bacterium]
MPPRRSAWNLGSVAGIRLQMHWTFPLLLVWVVVLYVSEGAGVVATLQGVVLILTLFGCIVLHELGHALMARREGIATRDITLLPIGGVARLDRMPDHPAGELRVAAAGPAVTVGIAVLLYLALRVSGWYHLLDQTPVVGGNLLVLLFWANVMILAFNLLPAFPMDGGRILRALLSFRMERVHATAIAARLGQGMAVLFGVAGLLWNPFLILIGIFVYFGAAAEAHEAQVRHQLEGVPVRAAMMTDLHVLAPDQSVDDAAEALLASAHRAFPVTRDGHLVGLITRRDIVRQRGKAHGGAAEVRTIMRRDPPVAREDDPLVDALRDLEVHADAALPVVRNGTLVGLLTTENVQEYLALGRES